jgi:pyruvate formate lyase activating enzyme
LDYIGPFLSAYKVDLKSFNDRSYRSLGGTLAQVLEGIRMIHARGIWLEIVTLLIPGFNDSEMELRELTAFIRGVSPDIPWHVTAFHPDYKMTDPPATSPAQLVRAAEIGRESGLRYVYAGNAPGQVGAWENTLCPQCAFPVIERHGFRILSFHLTCHGQCSKCGTRIPGVWSDSLSTGEGPAADRWPRRVALPRTQSQGS